MRHLKKYENGFGEVTWGKHQNTELTKIYKVGDYVLIYGKIFQSGLDTPAKIVRQFDWGDFEHMYDNGSKSVSEKNDYKRFLTSEEIEKFNIKIDMEKYNL